ncbi:hypothetical protein M011DRAFT_494127 [Sporormia fimetaria CBS 119925]|uniref:2-dehydropantoate 2-reductase n=1 Tax=Sporormia fimetaria CBS 119925 TaxID=1340428 RepID=A0A6A6VF58_9PLEO|nr:hypothetical protein M011DRAFT_494127 [Sporormia fimetaria CBS 119925]
MPSTRPPSIHILGTGNLGSLLAFAIRKHHPHIPVTLLFHRPSLAREWRDAGEKITVTKKGVVQSLGWLGVEYLGSGEEPETGRIENLIVATKSYKTVEALRPLVGRLERGEGKREKRASVLFCQNGIGTIDSTLPLFPNPQTRPYFLTGIFNHGIYTNAPFSITHAGIANAFIGPAFSFDTMTPTKPSFHIRRQRNSNQNTYTSNRSLLNTLSTCHSLSITPTPALPLLHIQLAKLAVNAVINPLTALFRVQNGVVFENEHTRRLAELLVAELSPVLLGTLERVSQDLSLHAESRARFSVQGLMDEVKRVCEITKENKSSMRQDVEAGRKTEVGFINGWVVRMGRELGVDVRLNERVVELVEGGVRVDAGDEGNVREAFGV